MKRGKKGSHVGMVLSFVIFITFIVFIYSLLEPSLREEADKETELELLEVNLLEKVSDNITIITITNSSPKGVKDCLRINFSEFKGRGNVRVKGINDHVVGSTLGTDNLRIDWGSGDIFKIYTSPTINSGPASTGVECMEGSVQIVQERKHIFNESLNDLFIEYNETYETLKNSLGVGTDFGFGIGDREIPEEVDTAQNVYVKEIVVEIMNSTAHINPGFVRIKVW